jgi:exodeoxyribonuclease-3
MIDLISWNVNGIRACEKKGLFEYLSETAPDFLCLQETKAQTEQLYGKFLAPEGYKSYFSDAEKKGYSGTVIYVKETWGEPDAVYTLGIDEFDSEGRTVFLDFPGFTLANAYFPNSQDAGARIDYKIRFCRAMKDKLDELVASGRNVVLCGDYNIAHKPIDLARPKQNEGNPGYLPEEREWMDIFTQGGYTDTFRLFNQEPDQYSWWSYRFKAREKNLGWRIDYFCVNDGFVSEVENAQIHQDVLGSDHCPVSLTLKRAPR